MKRNITYVCSYKPRRERHGRDSGYSRRTATPHIYAATRLTRVAACAARTCTRGAPADTPHVSTICVRSSHVECRRDAGGDDRSRFRVDRRAGARPCPGPVLRCVPPA
eukprot:4206550-Prymnesium_polylepis.2